ncbi:MAG: SpoIIE family protein phosphatase [Deltaproteobacteria bacterium]|nr:SpoIIE family protein phosphatase [Deltaproteobacteria bacterium]
MGASLLAVIDGTGHGPEAAEAARQACQVIGAHAQLRPAALLERCHRELRTTRGAAMGLLRIDSEMKGQFAGVGNVAVVTRSTSPITVLSHAGIVGHRMRKVHEFEFRCGPGDLICLYSDGVRSSLRLDEVLGLPLPQAAERILDTYGKSSDDATVLLVSL